MSHVLNYASQKILDSASAAIKYLWTNDTECESVTYHLDDDEDVLLRCKDRL